MEYCSCYITAIPVPPVVPLHSSVHFISGVPSCSISSFSVNMSNQVNGQALRPAVLLIPGSFSKISGYTVVIEHLQHYGYEVVYADIPSIGRRDPAPPATMADDAECVNALATELAAQGKDIVLVTHSYGGVVGSECTKNVSKKERQAAGKPGGIIQLLYMTSIVPRFGESMMAAMPGDKPGPFLIIEASIQRVDSVWPLRLTAGRRTTCLWKLKERPWATFRIFLGKRHCYGAKK